MKIILSFCFAVCLLPVLGQSLEGTWSGYLQKDDKLPGVELTLTIDAVKPPATDNTGKLVLHGQNKKELTYDVRVNYQPGSTDKIDFKLTALTATKNLAPGESVNFAADGMTGNIIKNTAIAIDASLRNQPWVNGIVAVFPELSNYGSAGFHVARQLTTLESLNAYFDEMHVPASQIASGSGLVDTTTDEFYQTLLGFKAPTVTPGPRSVGGATYTITFDACAPFNLFISDEVSACFRDAIKDPSVAKKLVVGWDAVHQVPSLQSFQMTIICKGKRVSFNHP